MKKQLICFVMLLISTATFSQNKPWNENTRDAAYEAPNSMFQKKWYVSNDEYNTVREFAANGTFKDILKVNIQGVGVEVILTLSGKYTRNKDHLSTTYTGVKATPNQSDIAALAARKRDAVLSHIQQLDGFFASEYKNKTEHHIILRLDEECMILAYYDPQTKIFNDVNWTTLYNETYKEKEAEREAQKAIEQARLDSIAKAAEQKRLAKLEAERKAKLEAEIKARREAEERAKREAEERARQEEARIKAENEYWARMGDDKRASAQKAEAEGVKLVDLGLSVRWADRNIGAVSPEDLGSLFKWGEMKPNNKPVMKPKKGAILNEESDPATVKWGVGFHVPTPQQWEELFNKCTIKTSEDGEIVTIEGPNGNKITMPTFFSWTNTMSEDDKRRALVITVDKNKMICLKIDVQDYATIRAVME